MSVAYDDEGLKAQRIPKPPPGSPHPKLGEYWDRVRATREKLNEPRTIDEIAEDRETVKLVGELYKRKPTLLPAFKPSPLIRWDIMGVTFALCVLLFAATWLIAYDRPMMVQHEPPPAPRVVVQSTLDVYKSDNFVGPMLEPGVDFTISEPIEVGAYGVLEDGQVYENARLPARPAEVSTYRVTCYGPPMFPESNNVARWPLTVADGLSLAESMGLDGICAVSPGTPWYDAVTSERLVVLHVEDHGEFLVINRMAQRIRNGVDLYNPYLSSTNQWSHSKEVWEVQDDDEM